MADEAKAWARVGRTMQERFESLGITLAELSRLSGVSDTQIRGYFRGAPVKRADKKRGMCEGLGWSAESIDLVLQGKKPIVLNGAGPRPDLEVRVTDLETRAAAVDERLDEILRLLRAT